MVMGYSDDTELGEWGEWLKATETPMEAPRLPGFDDTLLKVMRELPDTVRGRIGNLARIARDFSWDIEQAANEHDHELFDRCPECLASASTIAVQLTYYGQEPATVHMWCLSGHAWRWNEIEGRVREPSKWQR